MTTWSGIFIIKNHLGEHFLKDGSFANELAVIKNTKVKWFYSKEDAEDMIVRLGSFKLTIKELPVLDFADCFLPKPPDTYDYYGAHRDD